MIKKRNIQLFSCLVALLVLLQPAYGGEQRKTVVPMLSLLLAGGDNAVMEEKKPSLALLAAKDTDKVEMAWVPGSDGVTPMEQVVYKIYLSTSGEDFTPSPATLKKTVTGTSQTEITNLATDTLYYAKVVAVYPTSSSDSSNTLHTKTYKYKVLVDTSTVVVKAADLGLGKHTSTDGVTYIYTGGTPPAAGSVLFSEDAAGGMTLRTVDSASSSGGTVTVHTSAASLTHVLDRGSIYSAFQLFDIEAQAKGLPGGSRKIAAARRLLRKDGSSYSRIDWKNGLLSAEQTNYAYNSDDLVVIPKGKTSVIKMKGTKVIKDSFTASVSAQFFPELITIADWGEGIVKELNSAHVAAKGILTLSAFAQYDFSAEDSVEQSGHLWERRYEAKYPVGGVFVYQEIILSLDWTATASAETELKATATANFIEDVEVGARYNGIEWESYIEHKEEKSLTATLDIVGKANAEIRLIPKIEVKFYKVVGAELTVEPFIQSGLTFEESSSNVLTIHPERLLQLTSFDASLGMEAKISAKLSGLGLEWVALEPTCVLGTGSCLYSFNALDLFSIPDFSLSTTSSSETQTEFKLRIEDGDFNPFSRASIRWEVYPEDATLTPVPCSKSGSITTCTATFEPGVGEEYTVFASGHGEKLNEAGRQYKEITLGGGSCTSGAQTVNYAGHEWQRCDDNNRYSWENAKTYCSNLSLAGHSDWRLPTQTELKSLVVCSNGKSTPLADMDHSKTHEQNVQDATCSYDGSWEDYSRPTIDMQFSCHSTSYWSSSVYDENGAWSVYFYFGSAGWDDRGYNVYVRCVR